MMKTDNVTAAAAEHAEWLRGLDFYRDEVALLEERLLRLSQGRAYSDAAKDIEHFQNQLIIQRNNIDELAHAIREHMSRYGHAVATGDGRPAARLEEGHGPLREGYTAFEKVMNELRHEFNGFFARMD
jgi:hypothetical protein